MFTFLMANRDIQRVFLVLGLILLFIPKINIIPMGTYEGAGLRIDDFVILALFMLLLSIILYKRSFNFTKFELVFLCMLALSSLSLLFNLPHDRGSPLYVLRLLEYFVFFYIGVSLGSSRKALNILIAWTLINVAISILQYYGLIGGYYDGNYMSYLPRPTGLTNGAYEGSMVVALTFALYCGLYSRKRLLPLILAFLIAAGLIAISAARMPLGLVVLVMLATLWRLGYLGRGLSILSMALVPAVIALSIQPVGTPLQHDPDDQRIDVRIRSLFATESINIGLTVFNSSPYETGPFSNADSRAALSVAKQGEWEAGDFSALRRLSKWVYAAKSYLHQDWIYWLFGLGPGVWGNALDGGILRFLTENGVLAFMLFIGLFLVRPRRRGADPLFLVLITFYLGNLAIDYYLSYKVMACLLLIIGAHCRTVYSPMASEDSGLLSGFPSEDGPEWVPSPGQNRVLLGTRCDY